MFLLGLFTRWLIILCVYIVISPFWLLAKFMAWQPKPPNRSVDAVRGAPNAEQSKLYLCHECVEKDREQRQAAQRALYRAQFQPVIDRWGFGPQPSAHPELKVTDGTS